MGDENYEVGLKATWDSDDAALKGTISSMRELKENTDRTTESTRSATESAHGHSEALERTTEKLKEEVIALAGAYAGFEKLKEYLEEAIEKQKLFYQIGDLAEMYGENASEAREKVEQLASAVVSWGGDEMKAIELAREYTDKLGSTSKAVDVLSLAYQINARDGSKSTSAMASMLYRLEEDLPRAFTRARLQFPKLLEGVKSNQEAIEKLRQAFGDTVPNMDLAANRMAAFKANVNEFGESLANFFIPVVEWMLTSVTKIGQGVAFVIVWFRAWGLAIKSVGQAWWDFINLDIKGMEKNWEYNWGEITSSIKEAGSQLLDFKSEAAKPMPKGEKREEKGSTNETLEATKAAYLKLEEEKVAIAEKGEEARLAFEETYADKVEELSQQVSKAEWKEIQKHTARVIAIEKDVAKEREKRATAEQKKAAEELKAAAELQSNINQLAVNEFNYEQKLRDRTVMEEAAKNKAIIDLGKQAQAAFREQVRGETLNRYQANQLMRLDMKKMDAQELAEHKKALAAATMAEGLSAQEKVRLNQAAAQANIQIAQLEAKNKQQLAVQGMAAAIGTLAGAFPEIKAFAMADALMSTYQGAANALATVPYPFNFIAAATVVAAGLKNVAQINRTEPGSGGGGGGGGYGGGGGGYSPNIYAQRPPSHVTQSPTSVASYSTHNENRGGDTYVAQAVVGSTALRQMAELEKKRPAGARVVSRQVMSPKATRMGGTK